MVASLPASGPAQLEAVHPLDQGTDFAQAIGNPLADAFLLWGSPAPPAQFSPQHGAAALWLLVPLCAVLGVQPVFTETVYLC